MNIHPLGRLFFGLGFFVAALIAHDMIVAVTGLLVCIALLRIVNQSWVPVFKAIRLLLWLILPICILHLLLTPGARMWPGSILPFTWEGADRAAWLSTRLLLLFFSAMLLSRSLNMEEWRIQICHIPIAGRRLYPYLQLFYPMREMTASLARKHWRESRPRRLTAIPEMIVRLIEDVLISGHEQAKAVWEGWNDELPSYNLVLDGRAWLLITIGICLPFAAWVA